MRTRSTKLDVNTLIGVQQGSGEVEMIAMVEPGREPDDNSQSPALDERVSITTEILVTGMEVMADIGIHSHEVGNLQPLRLSVRLQVHAVERDSISEAFDYSKILTVAQKLALQRIALIETFAQRFALTCLISPLVVEADVAVEKPQALPGCVAGARVRVRRLPAGR